MLESSTYTVLDYGSGLESAWQKCLKKISDKCRSDALYENYVNLDPSRYLSFNVILNSNREIICFGAIDKQPKKWGNNLARVLTRFWIDPDHRSTGLTKWGSIAPRFSPIILSHQLKILESRPEVMVAMITREGSYTRSFREIVRLANTASTYQFDIQDGIYNICEKNCNDINSCHQMIALSQIKNLSYEKYLEMINQHGFLERVK